MMSVVVDALARWFLRAQATLTMSFMAALPFADRDVKGAFFWAAVAIDIARWALSRFRWLPLALGVALVCCALALCVAAIAGGATSPLPIPAQDYDGAPLFDPRSCFLSSVEAAGGGGFLFSLIVAMFMGQAGVFLMFAGERSVYLRRHWAAEWPKRPERLGLLRGIAGLLALCGLLVFFALIAVLGIFNGLVLKKALADPAAALDSVLWRIVTAQRFLIPSSIALATAIIAWCFLNGMAMKRELNSKAESTSGGGVPD